MPRGAYLAGAAPANAAPSSGPDGVVEVGGGQADRAVAAAGGVALAEVPARETGALGRTRQDIGDGHRELRGSRVLELADRLEQVPGQEAGHDRGPVPKDVAA